MTDTPATPDPQPTREEAASWCRDAWFVLTIHGDGQGTSLHQGWEAICEAVLAAHYFKPDDEQRAEVMARFTDWQDWENVGGYPWRWFRGYEDRSVSVERVTDRFAAQHSAAGPQDGDRSIIVGNYTIDRLRHGETVEASGITLLPADDLRHAVPVSGTSALITAAEAARDLLRYAKTERPSLDAVIVSYERAKTLERALAALAYSPPGEGRSDG